MSVNRVWRLAVLVGVAIAAYTIGVRPWHRRWGATREEVARALPGDELVAAPVTSATHAITIRAPAGDVWPWLVQLGQNRGGLYSYQWLENLVGCQMRNTDRIIPELQHLQEGVASDPRCKRATGVGSSKS